VARALEEEYDVIMPDSRGHGNSSAPEDGYRYETLAGDVLSLIGALRLIKPILVGHSMGGMTAAVVAAQNPQQLQALVLADPAFLTSQRQREVYESDVAVQHQRVLNSSREGFLAELRIRHRHRSPELVERFAEARFGTSMHAFDILTPPNPDYRQLISTLAIPSLLVIGGVGGVVTPEVAAELATLNSRLEVAQIEEAGHAIPYDHPERFAAILKTFLSGGISLPL
jgi:pimeloyl-ACP methyl ester carboxylesterase